MIQNYQELIDKYLKDEMSSEEKVEFEKRLSKDKGLRKEYELTFLIAEELLSYEMREQISEWHSQIDNETNKDGEKRKAVTNKKKKKRNLVVLSFLSVAAFIISGVLLLQYYLPDDDHSKDSSIALSKTKKTVDSTNTKTETTDIQSAPVRANTEKENHLNRKQTTEDYNIIKETPIVTELNEISYNSSLEPEETDADVFKSRTDDLERNKIIVFERYKNSKKDFCELFTDSAAAEKVWISFIQNPTDEKWTLLKSFLDERIKNPKKTTFALREKLSKEMQEIAKKADY